MKNKIPLVLIIFLGYIMCYKYNYFFGQPDTALILTEFEVVKKVYKSYSPRFKRPRIIEIETKREFYKAVYNLQL